MTDFMSGIVPVESQLPNVIPWNEFHAEMRIAEPEIYFEWEESVRQISYWAVKNTQQ